MVPLAQPTLEFIGTATTLLRLGPFTLLTDPNFLHKGQRAYLGKGLFSKRRTEPSMQPHELPPYDAIVLSHLHGDHFDRVARKHLNRRPPVFTTPEAAARLREWGFDQALGLEPWQDTELNAPDGSALRITSAPGEHAPGLAKAILPPVMGSVLELRQPDGGVFRAYITGDTLYRDWLGEVTERHGPIDAMVMHLGGTRVLGLLVTMDAEQGGNLVELLRPGVTVPVHYDDYTVFRSPLSDFVEGWKQRGLPGELRVVRRGETVPLSRTP